MFAFLPCLTARARLLTTTLLITAVVPMTFATDAQAQSLSFNNDLTNLDDSIVETQDGQWSTNDSSSAADQFWTGNEDGPPLGGGNVVWSNGAEAIFTGTAGRRVVVNEFDDGLPPLAAGAVPLNVAPTAISFEVHNYRLVAGSGEIELNTRVEVDVRNFEAGVTNKAVISADLVGTGVLDVNGETLKPDRVAVTAADVGAVTPELGKGLLVLSGDNSGATGSLSVFGGIVENRGNWGGAISVQNGIVRMLSGTVTGNISVTGPNARFVSNAVSGGSGATFLGDLNMTAGNTDIRTDTTIDSTLSGGTLSVFGTSVLTGTLTQTGGTVQNNNSIVGTSGTSSVTGGVFNNNGAFSGALNVGAVSPTVEGTFNLNSGSVTGAVGVSGGEFNMDNGALNGAITLTGGAFNLNNGTATGNVVLDGGGDFNLTSGSVVGLMTNNGGAVNLDGGSVSQVVRNNSGTLTVDGTFTGATTGFALNNAGGQMDILLGSEVIGAVSNTSGDGTNSGTITGVMTVDGTHNAVVAADNDVFDNFGTITGSLNGNGGIFNAEAGSSIGLFTNISGAVVNAKGGTFGGAITVTENAGMSETGRLNILANLSQNVSMDAGATTIGAGVALTGTYTQSGGTMTSDGRITDLATITGGTLILRNGGRVEDAVTLTAGEIDVRTGSVVTGAVTNNGGQVRVNGGQINAGVTNNSGTTFVQQDTNTAVVNEGGTVNVATDVVWTHNYVSNSGITNNAGLIAGAVVAGGTGAVDVFNNTGEIAGQLSVTGGVFNHNASALTGPDVGVGGRVTVTGGTFNAAGGTFGAGLVNNGGTINVSGATTVFTTNQSGNLNIFADQVLTGAVRFDDGAGDNKGTITAGVTMADGTFSNFGSIGGTVVINDGAFTHGVPTAGMAAVTNEITGRVTVNDGTFDAAGGGFGSNLVIDGGDVTVSENSDVDVALLAGGLIVNSARTLTGDVTMSEASVTALSSILNNGEIDGAVTMTAGTMTNVGEVGGAMDMSAGQLTSSGDFGSTVAVSGGTLDANGGTVTGLVTVTNAVASTPTVVTIDATDLVAGLTMAADTSVTFDGGTSVVTGEVRNTGGTAGVTATVTLDGDYVQTAGSMLNAGTITGDVTKTGGTMTTSGTVGGAVRNLAGGFIINDGIHTLRVVNSGTMTVNGGQFDEFLRNTSGSLTIADAIVGDLVSAGGTVAINAEVDGDATTQGATTVVTQIAEITGALTVTDGTHRNNGTVTGRTTVNGGTLATTTNGTFTDIVQVNGGSFDVTGTAAATGGVRIAGATADLTVGSTGQLNGAVTQTDGQLINGGVVNGAVTMSGGTADNQSGGRITGLMTVAGGSAVASGGRFEGGVRITGGTLDMTADTFGDITNIGTVFEVDTGLTLDGAITQNGGSLIVRGDVTGDVTMNSVVGTLGPNGQVDGKTIISNGTVLTANGGTLVGGAFINGSSTLDVTGNLAGDVRNNSGDVLIRTGQNLNGVLTEAGGKSIINGGVTQGLLVVDGVVTGNGDIAGGALLTGGRLTLNNTATLTGGLDVRNDAIVTNRSGASIQGAVNVRGGRLNADGGTFDTEIVNTGGVVTFTDNTTVDLLNIAGTVSVGATVIVTGDTNNRQNALLNMNGTLAGDLINAGTANIGGTVLGEIVNTGTLNTDDDDAGNGKFGIVRTNGFTLSGPTTVIGGQINNDGDLLVVDANLQANSLISDGTVFVSNDKVFVLQTTAAFLDGSSLAIDNGTLVGDVTIAANSPTTFVDATIEGNVVTLSDTTASGTNVIETEGALNGDFIMNGGASLSLLSTDADDVFAIDGTLSSTAAGGIAIAADTLLEANNIISAGSLTMGANSRINTSSSDGLVIDGGLTMGDNARIGGRVFANSNITGGQNLTFGGFLTNRAALTARGTLNFNGGLNGNGRINVQNGAVNDVINVGNALGNQRFSLDIDLSENVGVSDTIVMSSGAVITGDVVLDFNLTGQGGRQDEDVVVVDVASGDDVKLSSFSAGTSLRGTDPIISYALNQASNGDIVVTDGLNPAVGALAGNIVLTQSLIGSVINRPSSPFVSGLAFADEEDPCGAGVWARATGGAADSSGTVTQAGASQLEFDGEISANFYGVQLGGDYACFNGYFNGFDVAFGGIAGINYGTSQQPVFDIDLSKDGNLSDNLISVTDIDFTQTYGGLYVAAVRDALAVDLQYRLENTDYTATNEAVGNNASLGLDGEKFTSEAQTLSGSVSYSFPIKETDFTIVPTAGFAYTRISTDPINFGNRGIVEIDDFESQTAFIGGTVSRTIIGADGVSAINQFGTATYYHDFADAPTSRFTPNDGSGTREIATQNLGGYGELSAGLNYVKILQPGELGQVKQFNASVRGDIRYSDRLESWGVTAQARFQF